MKNPQEMSPDLTFRRKQIIICAARGLCNAEIAGELGIAPNTVKNHLRDAFTMLGVDNRTSAVVSALKSGMIVFEDVDGAALLNTKRTVAK